MAGAISRRIPAVSSLLINKLLFLELSCTQLLTSYHADISLINKQYRKRGHKLHTAAKNSTNNHRPNGQTCLRIFASKWKSGSNLLKDIEKRRLWYLIQRHVFFFCKSFEIVFGVCKTTKQLFGLTWWRYVQKQHCHATAFLFVLTSTLDIFHVLPKF